MGRIKENGRKVSKLLAEKGKCGFQNMDKERLINLVKQNGAKGKGRKVKQETINKIVATKKEKMANNKEYAEKTRSRAIKNIEIYNQKVKAGEIRTTEKQQAARKNNALRLIYNRFYKNKFDTFESYLEYKNYCEQNKNNHKVKKTELYYENCNTYNLLIDKYKNFAVSAGIFTCI